MTEQEQLNLALTLMAVLVQPFRFLQDITEGRAGIVGILLLGLWVIKIVKNVKFHYKRAMDDKNINDVTAHGGFALLDDYVLLVLLGLLSAYSVNPISVFVAAALYFIEGKLMNSFLRQTWSDKVYDDGVAIVILILYALLTANPGTVIDVDLGTMAAALQEMFTRGL